MSKVKFRDSIHNIFLVASKIEKPLGEDHFKSDPILQESVSLEYYVYL